MSVSWNYYDKFDEITDKYLPSYGEGETLGTQLVTAINKLIYKWYNDGDVFDTTGTLKGWANDLSSYANWIYKHVPHARKILDKIFECSTDDDYENLLKELADSCLDVKTIEKLNEDSKDGSIYDCEGPFEFVEDDEDEDEYEEEEMWEDDEDEYEEEEIESSVDVMAADDEKNEALEETMRNLKDDFDFIISGLEKLDRSSAEDSRISLEIAEKFYDQMQEVIADISERF